MLNFILKTTGFKKDKAPAPEEAPKQQLRRSSRRKSSLVSMPEAEPEATEPQAPTSEGTNTAIQAPTAVSDVKDLGVRKSGRVWKAQKTPLRIRAVGLSKRDTAWERKRREQLALKAFKEKARELKEEKEAERKVCVICYIVLFLELLTSPFFLQRVIEARKAHKLAKEEKERYELLAKKMHAKVCLLLQLRSHTIALSLTY